MKIKRLASLLEGLYKTDPEANVTFNVPMSESHARLQMVDINALGTLDIKAIYICFGTPGGEEPETPKDNFMDVVIDLQTTIVAENEIIDTAKEFDKEYKMVAE